MAEIPTIQTSLGGIAVVDWIAYSDTEEMTESIGGMGGWFGWSDDNTWDDYLESWKDEVRPYAEALKENVLSTGRFINGYDHQYAEDGVPLFSDGTIGSFSMRAWGDLMAAIATVKDGGSHNYMEFYC